MAERYNYRLAASPLTPPRTTTVPWTIWCSVAAVTSAMIGVQWDISWHRSIGRDTFWTPAHLAIHFCGVLAGLACAYLVLSTTFAQNSPLRAASVRIWGFRGPLGAFVAAWGGIAMLTSAPFDNWWHNAYGLDVKILSPPHVLLAMGIGGVECGALLLILGYLNRAPEEQRGRFLALFLYVGGMILVTTMVLEMELTSRVVMHTAHFYRVVATGTPLILAVIARASRYRWAATTMAAIYMSFIGLIGWILPIFPAEPKLGPVLFLVTRFTPPEFPLLLIVPAFALDLLWQRTGGWGVWTRSFVSAFVFVGAFAAAQWPFATFLNSPPARNAFFGTIYFGYNVNPLSRYARYQFVPETVADFWTNAALALAIAFVSILIGLAYGNRLRRIRR